LEEDGTDAFADVALVAPAFCFGLDLVWEVPFAARGDLRTGLTDLNFDFLAAILDLPCVSGSVERCHWHEPREQARPRDLVRNRFAGIRTRPPRSGVVIWRQWRSWWQESREKKEQSYGSYGGLSITNVLLTQTRHGRSATPLFVWRWLTAEASKFP